MFEVATTISSLGRR